MKDWDSKCFDKKKFTSNMSVLCQNLFCKLRDLGSQRGATKHFLTALFLKIMRRFALKTLFENVNLATREYLTLLDCFADARRHQNHHTVQNKFCVFAAQIESTLPLPRDAANHHVGNTSIITAQTECLNVLQKL